MVTKLFLLPLLTWSTAGSGLWETHCMAELHKTDLDIQGHFEGEKIYLIMELLQ